MSAARRSSTPEAVAERLRRRLLTLDYPDFARCVCALLIALGCERARLTGRREWKGYNRPGGGGYDVEAWLPGLAPRRIVAQVKQYATLPVHQRSVDELRGACLRAGAAEALLVTTSTFSEVVRRAAALPEPAMGLVAPVRLIDGEELAGLMVRHGLGVRKATRGRWDVDEAFFAGVSTPGVTAALPKPPAPARWRVTVRIRRCSCPTSNTCPTSDRGGRAKGDGEKGER